MLALADHAHDDGSHVFPSVPMVAWKTMYEERQVRRRLREFEELGYLVRETEGTGGRGRSTLYRIDLDALPMREPWRSVNPDIAVSGYGNPDISVNPDISGTKGGHFEQKPGHFEHKGGHSYVHLNVIETSKKPKENQKLDIWFDATWKIYRRKDSKQSAKRAYEKLNPTYEQARQIHERVALMNKSRQWSDRGYIPYFATFLNRGDWLDTHEPEITTQQSLEDGPPPEHPDWWWDERMGKWRDPRYA